MRTHAPPCLPSRATATAAQPHSAIWRVPSSADRYADSAKRIANHATINLDPSQKLVVELKKEIDTLKARLASMSAAGDSEIELNKIREVRRQPTRRTTTTPTEGEGAADGLRPLARRSSRCLRSSRQRRRCRGRRSCGRRSRLPSSASRCSR
eukprot:2155564-Prymnesium_polylepis.1